MKRAITSFAYGISHALMAGITYPSFEKYASRVSADFVPIVGRKFPNRNPHFEKFQIRDLLDTYDCVMWVDCDAIISKYACSIFDHVPQGHFAAVDEGAVKTLINVPLELQALCTAAQLPVPQERPFIYFNSGVFVVWKNHRSLFDDPPACIKTNHGINDQTLLNVRVALSGTPFCPLDPIWNMIWVPVGFENSHIVHFAGRHKTDAVVADMAQIAKVIT